MNKEEIKTKILEAYQRNPHKHNISKISLFGSWVYGKQTPDSDVDVLIEILPSATIGFFEFVDIKDNFEHYLGKKVDLLTPESLSPYFRKDVLQRTELIYEKT